MTRNKEKKEREGRVQGPVLLYCHRRSSPPVHAVRPAEIGPRCSCELDVVHLAGGLVIVLVEARHRGQVIVIFALSPSLVRRILTGESCDVFWRGVLVATHVTVRSSRKSTFDLGIVACGISHEEGRGLAVEGVGRVGVAEELRQEDFKDVDHVKHGRPGLVDDIEAHGSGPSTHVLATIWGENITRARPTVRCLSTSESFREMVRFDSGD